MVYTKDGIMAQIYVAFGQGTGPIRVSQDVCTGLYNQYYNRIDKQVIAGWDQTAVQALERIRAVGRLMAIEACQQGETALKGSDVPSACQRVERKSDTELCGGSGSQSGTGSPPK